MLKLHHASNTRSGRIVWLLEELQLPYELNKMEFHPKELKSEEHRARHPLGRVPVLEDDNVILYESGAIVEYILARHGNGALKPDVQDAKYPEFLQWFHYCEGMIMPPINTIVVQTILLPPERKNQEILEQAQKLLAKSLAPLNDALQGRNYFIGDFSAVDIMLGHSCYMARRIGCVSDEMKNLMAYLQRIETRPAFQIGIKA